MPLTTIEVEHVGPGSWVARLETGSQRAMYQGKTLAGVLVMVETGYWTLLGVTPPYDSPRPPVIVAG